MRLTCRRCGTPFRANIAGSEREPAFCCAGCAAFFRVPVDAEGNFPVNAHLVRVIAVALLYFNQLLLWGTNAAVIYQGKLELARRLALADAVAAASVWAAVFFLVWKEGALRGKDIAFLAVVAALLIAGGAREHGALPLMAAANAVLLGWNFRGIFRRKRSDLPHPGA